MYKINVLIVTYKQANVIGRNIESILQQKDYGLNKIIICDDCSPDNNWEVIQQYAEQYPNYIVAYRNKINLGIYGNSNRLMSLRGEADLYCWVEGDDSLCDGFFKKAQEFIISNNVKVKGSLGIFSDYNIVKPNGTIYRGSNKEVKNGRPLFGTYIRGLISWRASLFSAEVVNRFVPAILDKGLSLAESTFDNQWFINTEKVYYLEDTVGSIYYSEIGISTTLTDIKSDYRLAGALVQWEYYQQILVDERDRKWAQCNIKRVESYSNPTLKGLFQIMILYFQSMIPYGINMKKYFIFVLPSIKSYINHFTTK